jgi:hypothetical protein
MIAKRRPSIIKQTRIGISYPRGDA